MTVLMPESCWMACSPQPTTRASSRCLVVSMVHSFFKIPEEHAKFLCTPHVHVYYTWQFKVVHRHAYKDTCINAHTYTCTRTHKQTHTHTNVHTPDLEINFFLQWASSPDLSFPCRHVFSSIYALLVARFAVLPAPGMRASFKCEP